MKRSQSWVTVVGRPILVEPDPLHRPIAACPQSLAGAPPCRNTISVNEAASYSALVRIDNRRVCLNTTTGTTDWGALTSTPYTVSDAGQALVQLGA
jgi:hypothetical protein